MNDRFTRLLNQRDCLLADGATGTNLFVMGLQTGDSPELWNVLYPQRVAANHRAFIEAGSDIILTNSFGGNRYRLQLHQSAQRVAELNQAAARIARVEADRAGREVIVAGSMGPTGEILAPNGPLSSADATAAFAEQAQALADGGADVLWLETLSSREELDAALQGAASAGLPVVCTLSFDTNGRTMMGFTPGDLLQLAHQHPASPQACGSNCGVGAAEVVASIVIISQLAEADDSAPADRLPLLVAKANCGIPEYVDGRIVYNGTPALMADYARLARDAGARIIGGCCGTTAEHIRAMRTALDQHQAGPRPDAEAIAACLGEISTGARAQLHGDFSIAGGSASGRDGKTRPARGRRRARA